MDSMEKFLKSEAFESLDQAKKQIIFEFSENKDPDINDILLFIKKLNGEDPLSPNQQKQLLEALSESLSEADKRKISNIMEIVKAFS